MDQVSDLTNGERIVYTGKLHWVIFLPAITFFIIGAGYSIAGAKSAGNIFMTIGAFLLLRALMTQGTTELIVTDRRLIIRYGLFNQQTFTNPLKNIEAINVRKPFLGMFLDYGTITISGTGKSSAMIHHLRQPASFQQAIHEQEILK